MKELISKCCVCGCDVNLKEVCLTEETGEPICNLCDCENGEYYTQDQLSAMWHGMGRSE